MHQEGRHLIPFEELKKLLKDKLVKYEFEEGKAEKLAIVFAESSLDGVYSHGVNRFVRFIEGVKRGYVKKDNTPTMIRSFGLVEQWNGHGGPGILNASDMMGRAIEIARQSGIGCVGLNNTNHWMRGGTYGWHAADQGMIGICFTNTKSNMVPWGGSVTRIGNNPLIIAIPRKEGHVVMDMAISQYSFGKIQEYAMKKEKLPYPGGFDNKGNLTRDPATILHNEKSIPIGLWKGTALSMMLDLMASVLAGGDTTAAISSREEEYGLSQVFIAIQPGVLPEQERDRLINEVLHYTRDVQGFSPGERTYYPGEKTLMVREQNRKQGIPINRVILEEINKL